MWRSIHTANRCNEKSLPIVTNSRFYLGHGEVAGLDMSDIPSLPRSYCGEAELGFFFNISGSNSGCLRACLFRWSLRMNRLPHQGHSKFFSPRLNKKEKKIVWLYVTRKGFLAKKKQMQVTNHLVLFYISTKYHTYIPKGIGLKKHHKINA